MQNDWCESNGVDPMNAGSGVASMSTPAQSVLAYVVICSVQTRLILNVALLVCSFTLRASWPGLFYLGGLKAWRFGGLEAWKLRGLGV